MKIINITTIEQNDCAEQRTCHNGGGYHQPLHTIKLDNGATIIISDTSCGDFGSRICASYTPDGADKPMYSCYYGSMERRDNWESDIPGDSEWLPLVREALGYNLFTTNHD